MPALSVRDGRRADPCLSTARWGCSDGGAGANQVPREICLVMEYCEMDLSAIVRTMKLAPAHIR